MVKFDVKKAIVGRSWLIASASLWLLGFALICAGPSTTVNVYADEGCAEGCGPECVCCDTECVCP